MTNRFAFILAALVASLILADLALAGGRATLFVARHLADLVQSLAVWR